MSETQEVSKFHDVFNSIYYGHAHLIFDIQNFMTLVNKNTT